MNAEIKLKFSYFPLHLLDDGDQVFPRKIVQVVLPHQDVLDAPLPQCQTTLPLRGVHSGGMDGGSAHVQNVQQEKTLVVYLYFLAFRIKIH